MKKDVHPNYNNKITVTCACGNKFETGSTAQSISVDVCSVCHPFWTGKQTFVDIEGRVDKFKKKQDFAEKERTKRIQAIKAKIEKQKQQESAPKSLKEMLKAIS